MNVIAEAPAPRLDRSLCDDVDALDSTTEYIDVLCPAILDEIRGFRATLKSLNSLSPIVTEAGEWRTIEVLLNLLWRQNDIVRDTIERFANADRRGLVS